MKCRFQIQANDAAVSRLPQSKHAHVVTLAEVVVPVDQSPPVGNVHRQANTLKPTSLLRRDTPTSAISRQSQGEPHHNNIPGSGLIVADSQRRCVFNLAVSLKQPC